MAARLLLAFFAIFCSTRILPAQGLQTSYDQRGLTNLSYNGVSLVNLNAGLGDAFYVGGYNLGGNGAWGGIGNATKWNASSQTLTWSWNWGTVSCQFATPFASNTLNATLTVTNSSAQTLNGIDIYPFGLQFPNLPKQFGNAGYPQFHNNLDAASFIPADYGSGMLTLVDNDAKPLFLGFSPSGAANHYALVVGTNNDSSEGFLATAVPVNRPLAPGQTDVYSISLRFSPSGTDYHSVAADILTTYGQSWPQTLNWTDRRPIGELFITNPTASAAPNSSPNPRNYTVAQNINIQTPQGLAAFQHAVLAYADNSVQILKNMNAQGAIVWDLEGQQYPQPNTSYVGDPTQLPVMAPEMDGIADRFFAKFTNAGLKCGMTLRPQQLDFTVSPPNQNSVAVSDEAGVLIKKIQYAYNRWGCTIFYVDSDGGPNDATAPSTFQQVLAAVPQVLVIPENIWVKDSAYTAPLASFWAPYKPLHTTADEHAIWPNAFTVTYIGDAPNDDLSNNPNEPNQWNELVNAVAGGDILSFRAWFDDEPLNSQVTQIYQAAASSTGSSKAKPSPVASLTVTPVTSALTASEQQQFTAASGNTTTQAVSWSISPAGAGVISANGLYTAPALIAAQQTVTVLATSTADATKSAAAAITLNPTIGISVSPAAGALTPGQALRLTATVSGSTNQQVNWTVSPAGLGTVSSAGLYTAPASVLAPESVTVQATSMADMTKSAAASLTLNPSPSAPACPAPASNAFTGCYYLDQTFGSTQGLGFSRTDQQINFNWATNGPGAGVGPYNFSVRWQGNFTFAAGAYTFSVATDDGSILYIDGNQVINEWGQHPAYTATQSVKLSAGTHLIRLDYYQVGGGASASLSWTTPQVNVSVTPATATVAAGQTLQLAAAVSGTANSQVNWTVSPQAAGTVSSTGLYTAPAAVPSQQSVTVQATSTADPTKSASATLTLTPPAATPLNTCPSPASNAFTGCYYLDQTFGATKGLGFSRVDPQISFNWGTNGAGSGVGPYNFSVRWQGNFTFTAGAYLFNLSTDDGSILSIDGHPVISDWNDHAAYTITQPIVMSPGAHLVQVDYYQSGGGASASLSWTNPAVSVTVTPGATGMMSAGQTLQLTAAVSGASNSQVNWTVSPAGLGTVSAAGLYKAPASVNGQETVTVTAASVADPSKSATAQITLSPTPSAASCPAPAVNAFTGCYYNDETFGTSQGLAFSRTDSQINFNWGVNGPGSGVGAYNFSARWQGYFTFAAGTYTFSASTDDGSILYIDGQPVLNEWGDHPAFTANQPVVMTAGQHLVQLDYYQASGAASANLTWTNQ